MAARSPLLELGRKIEVRLRRITRTHVRLEHTARGEYREVRVGGGRRDLTTDVGEVQLGDMLLVLRLRPPRPRGGIHDWHVGGQRRGELVLRRHRRALKFDAAVQRRRRDVAGHLQQRRGARLTQQPFRAQNTGRGDGGRRILLNRARDRVGERDPLDGARRLAVNGRRGQRDAGRDGGDEPVRAGLKTCATTTLDRATRGMALSAAPPEDS